MTAAERRVRMIAFYLPQFHPIAENDKWWGKGFTEWVNVAQARPMFAGHYQPHIPADLGFYDLRVPETRQAQAELARRYGIEGFCYYHYWFAGRRILEKPLIEVLASGRPDFPFCLCWANETWTGIWHGCPGRTLIEQSYPGICDHREHFEALLPAFRDPRHILVDGRPLFVIYKPSDLPNPRETLSLWRSMAKTAGLSGLYVVGMCPPDRPWTPQNDGFDAKLIGPGITARPWVSRREPLKWLRRKYNEWLDRPTIHLYERYVAQQRRQGLFGSSTYQCIVHAWDNTPRAGRNGVVFHGSTPEVFRLLLSDAVRSVEGRPPDTRIVFLKSWNEWAEGNHLEPDRKFGYGYLEVIAEVVASMR